MERVTLLRLVTKIQDSLVYSIEFCCEHAVRTMMAIEEHLALIDGQSAEP
jgi:hypothetical protein